ncbi:MAG: transglycosylase SLT domain-containing protein [Alphaproteobacteria bacterium]|nr:transglycosylase SLT domain-containing protein [Alphaproteobacteria bacterium]MBU6472449.1 transglycosylase SLT domain-containing protein [Alphaproteobacteria bacterium]MDE2012517.1 transglycosylase SLT domain-containing protein [Alphaproteobacteria bacterium]MDE2072815.1 transglycosylase SLT domain-containing protein [Alphaproteobacteria bacterium]MDE2351165.1 transglycosylase SLT domain-containing protein [Alphaproteobacteria bacterium]
MLAEATATAQTPQNQVLADLRQAAAATGSDFRYLLSTAMRESSLKPSAKSGTSSAAGLFQFVSQTWLGMVKQYGAKFGLGSYSAAITQGPGGHYCVANPADRQAILALRNDPKVSALMAGEYANATKTQLESRLGRPVCDGELYAAHFLGPGAACHLIALNGSNPQANAATAFPAAAEANRSVFYNANGTAKTVGEVYQWALKQSGGHSATMAMAQSPAPAATPAIDWTAAALTQGNADNEWSALGLLADPQSAVSPLLQMTAMKQTPFVLTPGVVSILAALTPDGSSQAAKDRAG